MSTLSPTDDLWRLHIMAVDAVTARLHQITQALDDAGVPYAVVGGQAVALWVASRDPDAVRTTKDVDILLHRADLPQARAAARSAGLDYFEVLGVGMFVDPANPHPRNGVHLVWAGELIRPQYSAPAPTLERREKLPPGISVVPLVDLVAMKLTSYRDQDRVHLRDLIDVGLVGRDVLATLPAELAARLEPLLAEAGL